VFCEGGEELGRGSALFLSSVESGGKAPNSDFEIATTCSESLAGLLYCHRKYRAAWMYRRGIRGDMESDQFHFFEINNLSSNSLHREETHRHATPMVSYQRASII
jgi:hypothetical protein